MDTFGLSPVKDLHNIRVTPVNSCSFAETFVENFAPSSEDSVPSMVRARHPVCPAKTTEISLEETTLEIQSDRFAIYFGVRTVGFCSSDRNADRQNGIKLVLMFNRLCITSCRMMPPRKTQPGTCFGLSSMAEVLTRPKQRSEVRCESPDSSRIRFDAGNHSVHLSGFPPISDGNPSCITPPQCPR
jgi:hypothetical protein